MPHFYGQNSTTLLYLKNIFLIYRLTLTAFSSLTLYWYARSTDAWTNIKLFDHPWDLIRLLCLSWGIKVWHVFSFFTQYLLQFTIQVIFLKFLVTFIMHVFNDLFLITGSFLLIYTNEYHVPIAAYSFHGDPSAVRAWLESIRDAQVCLNFLNCYLLKIYHLKATINPFESENLTY